MSEAKAKRKREFLKPRGGVPVDVTRHGIVYVDEKLPFRYVFTTPTEGYVEVNGGGQDDNWWRVRMFSKYRRRSLADTIEYARKEACESIGDSFAAMTIGCAIEATGGADAAHYPDDDATLCGIKQSRYWSDPGVRSFTTDVMKITCRECRMRLINAVNAMPFVVDA